MNTKDEIEKEIIAQNKAIQSESETDRNGQESKIRSLFKPIENVLKNFGNSMATLIPPPAETESISYKSGIALIESLDWKNRKDNRLFNINRN